MQSTYVLRRIATASRLFEIDDLYVSDFNPQLRGSNRHTTANMDGWMDPELLVEVPGDRGEHRLFEKRRWGPGRYDEDRWERFVDDVERNGVRDAVFLIVEPDHGSSYHAKVKVSEGNHRIRAAYQAGLDRIPVQVRFFGHTERLLDEIPWEYRASDEIDILDYEVPTDAEFRQKWEITGSDGKVWGFGELRDWIADQGGWDPDEVGALMAMGKDGPMGGTKGLVPQALVPNFERVLG